jgi:hypothetical protein
LRQKLRSHNEQVVARGIIAEFELARDARFATPSVGAALGLDDNFGSEQQKAVEWPCDGLHSTRSHPDDNRGQSSAKLDDGEDSYCQFELQRT